MNLKKEPVDLVEGYETLLNVYQQALHHAQTTKGAERHAKEGEPFNKQKICEITRRVGYGFPLGQAIKKLIESERPGASFQSECLGALNYIAAAIIVKGEEDDKSRECGDGGGQKA